LSDEKVEAHGDLAGVAERQTDESRVDGVATGADSMEQLRPEFTDITFKWSITSCKYFFRSGLLLVETRIASALTDKKWSTVFG
jgi:hypothetical protein